MRRVSIFNVRSESQLIIDNQMKRSATVKVRMGREREALHHNTLSSEGCIPMDLHSQHLQKWEGIVWYLLSRTMSVGYLG